MYVYIQHYHRANVMRDVFMFSYLYERNLLINFGVKYSHALNITKILCAQIYIYVCVRCDSQPGVRGITLLNILRTCSHA